MTTILTFPDETPTLRLLLRRWRKRDAALLKAAIDDNLAHLQAWMPWAKDEPSPLEVIEDRIALFEEQFNNGKEWLYGIWSRDRKTVLGGAGLHPRIGSDGLEIGYWLQAKATGQGFATEVAECLTRLAFAQPSIERMQIRCDPRNRSSAAIPPRLGYRHLSTTLGDHLTPDGEPRETMTWELTRRQYAEPGNGGPK